MKTLIQEKLREIEEKRKVKILYACESGSRAWGFPSPDSDWDVRFLYLPEPKWYLSIKDRKDVIELPINDELDISGWELRKALVLLQKSNCSLLEWLDSPIVYQSDKTFTEQLRVLARHCFSPKTSFYHYLKLAERNYDGLGNNDEMRLKRYFYTLRPLLGCIWLENNKKEVPMQFQKLLLLISDQSLVSEIQKLIEIKVNTPELGAGPRIPSIQNFIDEHLKRYKEEVPELSSSQSQTDQLDELFYNTIKSIYTKW